MTELRILVHFDIDISQDGRRARHGLDDRRIETEMLVGVGQIARSRNQECDPAGRALRPNEEGNIFFAEALAVPGTQAHRIAPLRKMSGSFTAFVTFQLQSISASA